MNRLFLLILFVFFCISPCRAELLKDYFADKTLQDAQLEKPNANVDYNYESLNRVPIKLNITERISTKKDGVYDGQPLVFTVKKDVRYKGNLIVKQGTKFNAIVETSLLRGMNGIPSMIIVDKFTSEGIDSKKIKGTFIKKGLNLSLIVFPIKWALTPIPFVGSTTNIILGGHAKIKPKEDITIYYYPDWNIKS